LIVVADIRYSMRVTYKKKKILTTGNMPLCPMLRTTGIALAIPKSNARGIAAARYAALNKNLTFRKKYLSLALVS